ncbi:MAG: type IV secretion protein Rhs, partial [Gammaproteobacteria bacterium]
LVLNPTDTLAPTSTLAVLSTDIPVVTEPTPLRGTVQDENLVSYEVFVSPKDQNQWNRIALGHENVIDGELAVFDPTMLWNGLYDVVVRATDVNGQSTQDGMTVMVDGDLKVGHYAVTFEDARIDLAGIPVRVMRTYDTRRSAEKLDFGYGWSVDYQNVRVQESRTLGFSWDLNYHRYGFFGTYCVEPNGSPLVTIMLPDGHFEKFKAMANPECTSLTATIDVTLQFQALPGTYSTLEQLDTGLLRLANGNLVELTDVDSAANGVDIDNYKLTTKDGVVYYLNQRFGIRRIEMPDGQYITYSDQGIVHSQGYAVTFDRDAQGRIVAVILPDGRRMEYQYTSEGDLGQVTNFSGDKTDFNYLARIPHYLDEIVDPQGVSATRMEYDDAGHLSALIDADGNRVEYAHDLAGRTSIVSDARGNDTVYVYDERGRVLAETNALGETITRTYNEVGDVLSETNGLGETRSWTYDDRLTMCVPAS